MPTADEPSKSPSLLTFPRSYYSAADWQWRQAIFERVKSGQSLSVQDRRWLRQQGLQRWERDGKRIL